MDSDALIKLAKCSAKEDIIRAAKVSIPSRVKVETVDEARLLGYPDAIVIDENIRGGRLEVVELDPHPDPPQAELFPAGGDRALFLAFSPGKWDAVVSDDSKLLRLLRAFGVPALTPAALMVTLAKTGTVTVARARSALGALAPLVSPDEYATAQLALDALKPKEVEP